MVWGRHVRRNEKLKHEFNTSVLLPLIFLSKDLSQIQSMNLFQTASTLGVSRL